ncbi:glyoxalase family protein [Deinococcus reticulitermitis]|uniref:Glyoxalase family protein n=1 Tax=Deinococcus reticulitermitis TaxID=856736 RepID=A0A1H6UPM1_9DEIO|nr:VOC family protein [Deinococcus reticulitermitis]SEI89822.1 glyoxalase family protein [Deinococcus reticulitermitis]
MKAVQGLHHLTVMASDPQRNVDFYTDLLGQRMVKVTVNFDDPGTYHLYYGDETGAPGTIMTFFPWPGAARGERGNGEIVACAYAVRPPSLGYWKERLRANGTPFQEGRRFGSPTLSFEDPDGLIIELIAEEGADVPRFWPRSPVPREHALRGFHSVTGWVESAESPRRLLVEHLGFQKVGQEETPDGLRLRFRGDSDGVGLYVDLVERPGQPAGQFSAGSVHHVALRTRDDSEQAEYLEYLSAQGYGVTPVQDRQYFHSIYFRDPSGILFEIATDAPGFPADEEMDELGKHLKLPAWYEPKRAAIEARLRPIVNREYGVTIGGGGSGAGPGSTAQAQARPLRVSGPHQGQPVYAAGRPPSEARVAAVLIHGRGGSAQDILGLGQQFNLSAFTYVAPQAAGQTWYPQSFLRPLEQNEPGLSSGLQQIDDLLNELEAQGIPREHVVLGGFSQGACLALEYVARHARRYGAVFGFSGGLIGPDGTPRDYAGSLEGTPVFLGCSDQDAHIPLARVEESAEVLARLGAQVDKRIYPGMGHTINADEIAAVQALMQALAGQSV